MPLIDSLVSEIAISLTNVDFWLSVGLALGAFVAISAFGLWLARFVGLLDRDAPAGESLAVALATGLLVLTCWWATLGSGGRSAFTPIAISFAIAIGLAARRVVQKDQRVDVSQEDRSARRRRFVFVWTLGAVFIVLAALGYGATMALSPRSGVQPIEFMDEAFYSSLAADLAKTGTESLFSSSGFVEVPGLPSQTWYHWGELWFASAFIKLFSIAPVAARHFIVLPILLLGLVSMVGTLVRKLNGTSSSRAFVVGGLVALFLAPFPRLSGPWFSHWAVGQIFGISMYGLAAVAAVLAMYLLSTGRPPTASWWFASVAGSVLAFLLPAHIVLAGLALIGIVSVITLRVVRNVMFRGEMPIVSVEWRRTALWATAVVIATTGWGLMTGHRIGASGPSPGIAPFNPSWSESVLSVLLGGGVFIAIAIAWVLVRRTSRSLSDLYVGVGAMLAAGATAWGARLGDFNMFHVFFGGIAVFATPAAAVAMWTVWSRVRSKGHAALSVAVAAIAIVQLAVGFVTTLGRLQEFGPGTYAPVPLALLDAIRTLPANARIAYMCAPNEEVSYWDARLLGIAVHTDRRVIPLCFEADIFAPMIGGAQTLDMSPLFVTAPLRAIFPDAQAKPSAEATTAFLRQFGIGYIYSDAVHPNDLVPDAPTIAEFGGFRLASVP